MDLKAMPRILPFLMFMLFIALEEFALLLRDQGVVYFSNDHLYHLYPLKIAITTGLILFFWKNYRELNWKDVTETRNSIVSIGSGLIVFALWINLDINFITQGEPTGFDPTCYHDAVLRTVLIAIRLAGAVILVPIMEELFWRSFLIRYINTSDFNKTPIGFFTWPSFIITVVLFGFEHHYILAGIIAGVIFNLLLYYTKSITQCILSHAVANLALGIYVLVSGKWHFW